MDKEQEEERRGGEEKKGKERDEIKQSTRTLILFIFSNEHYLYL